MIIISHERALSGDLSTALEVSGSHGIERENFCDEKNFNLERLIVSLAGGRRGKEENLGDWRKEMDNAQKRRTSKFMP